MKLPAWCENFKLKKFLIIFGGIAVLLTLIPLIAMDYWWIRVFDFPHIQLTILTFTAFIVYFIKFKADEWQEYLFIAIMLGCLIFQYTKIHPYTPYAKEQIKNASEGEEIAVSIFTANVFQDNKKPEVLQQIIKDEKADVFLFLETNKRWQKDILKVMPESYKYRVEVPLDNTYGLLLYSKLELIAPEVKYLVDKEIPSVHSKLRLRNGEVVQLYALHPTPPMPQHNPSSSDRDAEMMKIANLSRESKLPVIVIGDFNDVAWSATTSLFHNVAELLDPRMGRGFYNSFNAKSTFMRWPLDHVFVSPEFRVKSLALGKDIHSDHFPTYVQLSFEPVLKEEQKPKPPSEKELKRAKEQAEGIRKVELDY